MPDYVITAVFEVQGAAIPPGRDVLASAWGEGHLFSYCDGHTLTLVVEAPAPDRPDAFEAVVSGAERCWLAECGQHLPAPSLLRVGAVAPEARVAAGRAGRGPDRLFAESTSRTAATLRATRAALAELESQFW